VPYTFGFADAFELAKHFDKHVIRRREFSVSTPQGYELLADEFLGAPLDGDMEECYRTKRDGTRGDKIRYNRVTQEYGVLSNDEVIRSYFIPDPARHGKGTNLNFFNDTCNEVRD
jgi:hypothetical protein